VFHVWLNNTARHQKNFCLWPPRKRNSIPDMPQNGPQRHPVASYQPYRKITEKGSKLLVFGRDGSLLCRYEIHKRLKILCVPRLSAGALFVHDAMNSAINYRCFICLPGSCVRHICAKEGACTEPGM